MVPASAGVGSALPAGPGGFGGEGERHRLGQGGRPHHAEGTVDAGGRGDHGAAEPEPVGFRQAAGQVADLAQLAGQAHLAHGDEILGQGAAEQRRRQRQAHGQVGAGLDHPHPAGHRDVDVGGTDLHPGPPVEHGEEQGQATAVHPRGRPAGGGQRRRRDQSLQLHQQAPVALHGREHHRTGGAGPAVGEEHAAGVGHAHQPALGHLEHAQLAGGPVPVLDGAQQPQGVVALALEGENGVHDVLQHPGAGEGPVLGDVTDEHGGHPAALGQLRQGLGAAPHLGHRAGCGLQLGIAHGLYRVHHQHVGARRRPRPRRWRRRRSRRPATGRRRGCRGALPCA